MENDDILTAAYAALKSNANLTALLPDGVLSLYHGWSPDAGTYPIVIYVITSDVPALFGDDDELSHEVTVRVSIMTEDGAWGKIYRQVQKTMRSLGYRRKMSNEVNDEDYRTLVVDYVNTFESEVN